MSCLLVNQPASELVSLSVCFSLFVARCLLPVVCCLLVVFVLVCMSVFVVAFHFVSFLFYLLVCGLAHDIPQSTRNIGLKPNFQKDISGEP